MIAYATLTHVGFVIYAIYFKLSPYLMRPEMQTYAHFEHVIAFALLSSVSLIRGARFLFAASCSALRRFWRSRRPWRRTGTAH